MSSNLRTRLSGCGHVFLLSGFDDNERKDLAKKINQLGGIYFDTQVFKSNCTHVVCGKLSRSEKFLGGCATGKWVLHPSYIHKSALEGRWLSEEDFEWNTIESNGELNDLLLMAEAPRRWRFTTEAYQKNAFSEWKVAVVVNGEKKTTVYKRLLTSGGAEVYNIKLPVTKPEKIVGTLTYIFVSQKNSAQVYDLMEYGVLCLKPEFIGDYLIKDPTPDPFDYLISPPGSSSQTSAQDTSLDQSQCSIDPSQTTASTVPSTPIIDTSSPSTSTPGSKINVCNKIQTRGSRSKEAAVLLEKIDTKLLKENHTTTNKEDHVDEREKDRLYLNEIEKENKENNSIGQGREVPNVSTKRKSMDDAAIEIALREIKKQRISLTRFLWRPTVLTCNGNLHLDDIMDKDTPVEMSSRMTGYIHALLEEDDSTADNLLSALGLITSTVTSKKFPNSLTVHMVITKVLQVCSNSVIAHKAYMALMKILHVHPPVTPTLVKMYLESLTGQVNSDIPDNDPANKQKFEFLKNVIKGTLDDEETPLNEQRQQDNNILLLKYLVALLEQNFQVNIKKFQHGQLNVYKLRSTMLSQLLWPAMNQVCLNGRCHDLLSLFEDCLACQMDEQRKIEVARLLLSLLCMALELCSCSEFGSQEVSGVKLLQGQKVSPFLDQISKKIYACKLDGLVLRQVLAGLQPSWISLGVCCCLLNQQDDYLILEGLPSGTLSLSEIVSKYFFLLPKFSNNSKSLPAYKSPHKKCTTSRVMDEEDNGNTEGPVRKSVRKSMANIINKRNVKGETPLHTACIKNNVVQLQQLLNIPGVDINVKDNAGWTPLHEACNHGNLQCVKELITFIPAKKIDDYFSKGEVSKSRKVDLLASTVDGITPLHDAVMNDRQDVCHLLLQHGGSKLLESKTIYNFTPMDLAYTDSMRSLLASYESDIGYRISSSQDSGSSQETTCPSDFRYQQVIGCGITQQFIDKEECKIYIYITTQLVTSYLHTTCIQAVAHKLTNSRDKMQHNVCMKQSSKNVLSVSEGKVASKTILSNSNESRIEIHDDSESLTLSDTDFEDSKLDLKILKKWPKYVQRFENHLLRISQPEDHSAIQSDLLLLHCVAG